MRTLQIARQQACRSGHCPNLRPLLIRAFTARPCPQRQLDRLAARPVPRSTAARRATSMAAAPAPSGHQLLVVGPGVLGSCLGKQWVDRFGAGTVTGQTNTTNNHARCVRAGAC